MCGGGGSDGTDRRGNGRGTAPARLKEDEEEEKKNGSVDLRLHYSPLTLLIANHDAAL